MTPQQRRRHLGRNQRRAELRRHVYAGDSLPTTVHARMRELGIAVPGPPNTLTDADRAECKRIAKRLRVDKGRGVQLSLKRLKSLNLYGKGRSAAIHNAEHAERLRARAMAPQPPRPFTGRNRFPKRRKFRTSFPYEREMPVWMRSRGGDEPSTRRNRAKARRRWLRRGAR